MENTDIRNYFANLPLLLEGKGMMQNRFHEWDVYNHTMQVVNGVSEMDASNSLLIAAYLHDLGKVINATPRIRNGEIQLAPNNLPYNSFDEPERHEITGANYIQDNLSDEIFTQFGANKSEILELVRYHFFPLSYIKSMWKTQDLNSFESEYNNLEQSVRNLPVNFNDLMTLFYADTLAKSSDHSSQENILMVYEHMVNNEHSLEDIFQTQECMKSQR